MFVGARTFARWIAQIADRMKSRRVRVRHADTCQEQLDSNTKTDDELPPEPAWVEISRSIFP
jgi:hypothetical protein